MNKNYLTYPCKVMRITQSYKGTTSHLPHTTGTPKDYPFDEGCSDTSREYFYCPCDEMVIRRIYGVGNGGTNTLWLESTGKVIFADGSEDFFTLMVTHPDDSELKSLSVGQKFKRKEKICREGKDGATSYHFHFSGGKGKFKGTGWVKNSKSKWVLTVTDKADKPENLFFIDKEFTKILNSKELKFKELTKEPEIKKYEKGNYEVTASLLNVRKGEGTEFGKKNFSELTKDAQSKIKAKTGGKAADGYVKGLRFTALEVKNNWGRTPSGWVCLDYCKRI